VIVTVVAVATLFVVTLNGADLAPAEIVTLAGVTTAGSELLSVTTAPPVGAAPFKVTVPVALAPPPSADGETETELATVGEIVNFSVLVVPPIDADITTTV
jgi:hypothetical protein